MSRQRASDADQAPMDLPDKSEQRYTRMRRTGLSPVIWEMSGERRNERQALGNFIHDAIDMGATTVEDIHKAIADLPLKILGESELLQRGARAEASAKASHGHG